MRRLKLAADSDHRWLCFFDLDGTVMCEYDDERPKVLNAFRALRTSGHLIILATGRAPASIPPVFLELSDGTITMTGSLCMKKDEIIFQAFISNDSIQAMARSCEKLEIPLFLENKEYFCAFGKKELFTGYEKLIYSRANLLIPDMKILMRMTDYGNGLRFQKACMNSLNYRRFIMSGGALPSGVKAVSAGDSMDIVAEEISKGMAADLMIRAWNWPQQYTICFGDSENDLELFDRCAVRISVGSSSQVLCEKATLIAAPADKDGAVDALIQLGLISDQK